MLNPIRALAALFALAFLSGPVAAQEWSLVIHGGAGVIERENMTPERDAEIRAALNRALDAGSAVLAEGGSAVDAVAATIVILEDDPNFNAGRGAVFTWDGTNELDASIMDGSNLEAGAVSGVTTTKNPILLARKVMDESRHVMLSGVGADQFSREMGLEQAGPDWFYTQRRFDSLQRFKARVEQDEKASAIEVDHKYGTVGAVAVDTGGNIAAGTSTGGTTGKRWGRIGDSPIIGAGTYAMNGACGVSATGTGEYFIRLGVAHEICTRLRLTASDNPQGVVDSVIADLGAIEGDGGVIYATPDGIVGWSFNTAGMYRGAAMSNGARHVAIYGDEE